MNNLSILGTLMTELRAGEVLPRIPEPESIMDEAQSVNEYTQAGKPNGILAGVYAYHLAQMSQRILPGDLVIDLGCGPANLLTQLAQLIPRADFIGIDLSAGMLQQADQTIKAADLRNIELRHDDISLLHSLPKRSVDVVISSMSLHHLPDFVALEKTFYAAARVLKPGGAIYLFDFGRVKDFSTIEYFVRRAVPEGAVMLATDYRNSLQAAFSKPEIEAVTRQAFLGRARVYATPISPLLIVVSSPCRRDIRPMRGYFRQLVAQLPLARRMDVAQMKLFLRLSGLKSPI